MTAFDSPKPDLASIYIKLLWGCGLDHKSGPFAMDLPRVFTLNNGNTVPAIGLGTFQGDEGNAKVKEAVALALKLGYRHIDGASAYGNEREIGQAIKESGIPRSEIYVTSKL